MFVLQDFIYIRYYDEIGRFMFSISTYSRYHDVYKILICRFQEDSDKVEYLFHNFINYLQDYWIKLSKFFHNSSRFNTNKMYKNISSKTNK